MMLRLSALATAVFAVACHHQTPPKPPPTAAAVAPAPKSAEPPPAEAASPNLAVSDDLAKQCSLALASTQAPKFDYDRFQLLPEDRDVLDKVATCLTNGPLKGKHVKLVGHADPRGTQEYNLGLGSERASTVRDYLMRLGVTQTQLAESTRGALDATGTDDSGWRTDRRVDLDLVQ